MISELGDARMKKTVIILCILSLSFGLFSCKKEEAPEVPIETPVETPAEEEPVEEPVETPEEEPAETLAHHYGEVVPGLSPLTGLPYVGDGKVIMVQMENTKAARPHSGLSEAGIIYEMEVESTITRLTAFFHGSYPQKAGPVRSARKQHMFLWSEWNYLYIYYGGSKNLEGQDIDTWRKDLGITAKRLDGTITSVGFSRSTDRVAPHNAYTNLEVVMAEAYDFEPKDRTLAYLDKEVEGGQPASKVSLSYRADNKITYDFRGEEGVYYRSINGEPMMDKENNTQISVKNIIVQHVEHYHVKDTVYTNMEMIGTGAAEYFIGGTMKKGTWVRENESSMTKYYDEEGKEMAFQPGKTFIQIMRPESEVIFEG